MIQKTIAGKTNLLQLCTESQTVTGLIARAVFCTYRSSNRPAQTANSHSSAQTTAWRMNAASPRVSESQHSRSPTSRARAATDARAERGPVSARRRRCATSTTDASFVVAACSSPSRSDNSPAMYCCVISDRHQSVPQHRLSPLLGPTERPDLLHFLRR